MASTELGACEWFVVDLRRSNLIDRGQLDQVIGEFLKKQPRAEPADLAQYLVHEGILSQFQADRLLEGKTQGLVLGPYTLMDAIGTGSMGTVYKAQSKTDNQWYAVKVLPRRSMWNVRIARRQVRAFEQCKHPSVVPFVDVGTAGSTHYLAWPFVEGVTLESIVQQQGKLEPALLVDYMIQTVEGMDLCHQNSLVHGLIKPSNLMIGSDHRVRILDYGIGTLLAETEGESMVDTMSTANSLTSGLDCCSPESIMDPQNRTPAGDQYSLGCVMYFCLTGQYPFPEGTAVDKMTAHQFKQPTPIKELDPDVPDELVAVVERLMQKSPEARYARTADIIEALRPIQEALPAARKRPTPAIASRSAAAARLAADPVPRTDNGHAEPPARTAPAAPPPPPVKQAPAASAPPPAPAAPSPRPTPRPRPAMPTRDSLRGPSAAAPVHEKEDQAEPSGFAGQEPVAPKKSIEDQLGPAGIIFLAATAAIGAWFIMQMLNR